MLGGVATTSAQPPAPGQPPDPSGRPLTELAAGVAAIVVGVGLFVVVPQLRHCFTLVAHGHFTGLRTYVNSLGAGGVVLLLGLMVLHAIVWYPSEIITGTAGFVYGFGPGLLLAMCGWTLAALLSYSLGRSVGAPLLRRLFGQRFEQLTETVERGGIPLLISARLIPVMPFAIVGYAAGATHVRLWRFVWTSMIGYLPLVAAPAYLGSQAKTLSTSNPLLWLAVAVLIGVVCAEQLIRRRSRRPRGNAGNHGAGAPATDEQDAA